MNRLIVAGALALAVVACTKAEPVAPAGGTPPVPADAGTGAAAAVSQVKLTLGKDV